MAHHDPVRTLEPDTQGPHRILEFRQMFSRGLDVSADPAQGNTLIQQRDDATHPDQVTEVEARPLREPMLCRSEATPRTSVEVKPLLN